MLMPLGLLELAGHLGQQLVGRDAQEQVRAVVA